MAVGIRIGPMLAIAAGLSACANPARHGDRWATATYTRAPGGADEIGKGRMVMIESRPCLLTSRDRSAILAALGRLEPIDLPDRETATDGPSAESGLVVVFHRAREIAMTLMLQSRPLRRGQTDVYILVNAQLARIGPGDLFAIQNAVRRSGCRISAHQRSVA